MGSELYLPTEGDWYYQLVREVHQFVYGFSSEIVDMQIPVLNIPFELLTLKQKLKVSRLLMPLIVDMKDMIGHIESGCKDGCKCEGKVVNDEFMQYILG